MNDKYEVSPRFLEQSGKCFVAVYCAGHKGKEHELLTPKEARQMAMELMNAADQAEASR